MNSGRALLGVRIGSAAAAGALILAGSTLNAIDRDEPGMALAAAAGLLAVAAGATFRSWRVAAPLGAGSLVLTLVIAQFNARGGDVAIQVGGLALLFVGGVCALVAYRSFAGELRRRSDEVAVLTARLGQKHEAFVAATSDMNGTRPGDTAAITAGIAANVHADFACCYLTSADGRRFVPQPPGVGVERLRPQAVNRPHGNAGPLLAAIESRTTYAARDENGLVELISYLPDGFHLQSVLAVPMPMGDHIGGFIVLGRSGGHFSEDDQRLAATLVARAGTEVSSAQLVAQTRHESARYSLMNELVKEASGKTMKEVLELVIRRGSEVIRYDAGRALLFQPDNTYGSLDGDAPASEAIDGPLARVRDGETMLRNLVTEDEGIYCGLQPERLGGTINEALTPIRGKVGVIGALCLGRRGNSGFSQQDVSSLDDLGSMAGVAVENSRILQVVSGQASRLDTALDALGEVSQALTTVTQGARVLEQKTLETAVRVTTGSAGLLTRSTPEGRQAVIMSLGLPAEVDGIELQNGQGIVGAVMLSLRATAVADFHAGSELQSPPDLQTFGIQ